MNFSTNFAAHPPVRTQRWWNSTGMDRKVHSFGTEVWPGLLIACSSRESKGKGRGKKDRSIPALKDRTSYRHLKYIVEHASSKTERADLGKGGWGRKEGPVV